jgi:DNA-binding transcriptional MerR regulator
MAADRLDDPDYPAFTTGRAAEALGVQQAFLRALDTVGAVTPQRSAGGHRRYTRRQLAFARRIRELFDQGHNLASSLRILNLQDDLAAERAQIVRLQHQLGLEQGHRQEARGEEGQAGERVSGAGERRPGGPR